MSNKIKRNTTKVDNLGEKFERPEKAQKKNKKDQKKKFENIRKEMLDNKKNIEENVTKAVVETLKPKIANIQTQVNMDIRCIVKEELELEKHQKAVPSPDVNPLPLLSSPT